MEQSRAAAGPLWASRGLPLLPTLRMLCVVGIRRRRCRHERSMEHVMDEEARRTEEGGREMEMEMEMEREKRRGGGRGWKN
jgi:hypothetical protein